MDTISQLVNSFNTAPHHILGLTERFFPFRYEKLYQAQFQIENVLSQVALYNIATPFGVFSDGTSSGKVLVCDELDIQFSIYATRTKETPAPFMLRKLSGEFTNNHFCDFSQFSNPLSDNIVQGGVSGAFQTTYFC